MKIRKASVSDKNIIRDFNIALALETENLKLDPLLVMQGVEAVLDDNSKGFYLLAIEENHVIGQLMITTEWSDWRNGYFWWIQSVFIHPDFRQQGVFKQLTQGVRSLANHKSSICGLRLYVDNENENARRVYQQLGWIETNYSLFEIDWNDTRK